MLRWNSFEGNFDPGAFVLAVVDYQSMDAIIIVTKLGHVKICFAKDAP